MVHDACVLEKFKPSILISIPEQVSTCSSLPESAVSLNETGYVLNFPDSQVTYQDNTPSSHTYTTYTIGKGTSFLLRWIYYFKGARYLYHKSWLASGDITNKHRAGGKIKK